MITRILQRTTSFIRDLFLSFRSIRGNARALLTLEPGFTILLACVNYYYPLYMQELGLSDTDIGIVASVGAGFGLFFSLVSGFIADRLGHKKNLFIFDMMAWVIPFLIWAIAQNFWYFIAAIIFNNAVKIAGVSWTCLIVDDTEPENRAFVFAVMNLLSLCAGIFTPLAGQLIKYSGLIPAMRGMYFAAFIYTFFMLILRNHWTQERRIPKNMNHCQKGNSFCSSLGEYRDLLKGFAKRPSIILLLIILSLTGFQAGLLIFNIIYLKDILKLQQGTLAFLPFLSSLVMLCIYLFVIPVLSGKGKDFFYLWVGGFIMVMGSLLYILASPESGAVIAASVMLTALGDSLSSPFKQSCLNNMVRNENRAKVISIHYVLMALFTIPSGVVAGTLYNIRPAYPFMLSLIILILNFILCLAVYRFEARPKHTSGATETRLPL